jgi:ATP-binding cassette subfamily G (WHITE) protein 2 (PDR)
MYRVSPFTYLTDAVLSVGVANTDVVCASNEYLQFDPPSGSTCANYMDGFISANGGYLQNPSATSNCSFCAISSTNTFLTNFGYGYSHRWRNFGFMWIYIIFNIAMALFIYWLVRMVSSQNLSILGLLPLIVALPHDSKSQRNRRSPRKTKTEVCPFAWNARDSR